MRYVSLRLVAGLLEREHSDKDSSVFGKLSEKEQRLLKRIRKYQVIDIRQSDWKGGHVWGSKHMEADLFYKRGTAEVAKSLYTFSKPEGEVKDSGEEETEGEDGLRQCDLLIFHCKLSLHRAPLAAKRIHKLFKELHGTPGFEYEPPLVCVLRGGMRGWAHFVINASLSLQDEQERKETGTVTSTAHDTHVSRHSVSEDTDTSIPSRHSRRHDTETKTGTGPHRRGGGIERAVELYRNKKSRKSVSESKTRPSPTHGRSHSKTGSSGSHNRRGSRRNASLSASKIGSGPLSDQQLKFVTQWIENDFDFHYWMRGSKWVK